MASGYSPWWKRYILYKIPFLYKLCQEFNYHLAWDKTCECGYPDLHYFGTGNIYHGPGFGAGAGKHWCKSSFKYAVDHLLRGGSIKFRRA